MLIDVAIAACLNPQTIQGNWHSCEPWLRYQQRVPCFVLHVVDASYFFRITVGKIPRCMVMPPQPSFHQLRPVPVAKLWDLMDIKPCFFYKFRNITRNFDSSTWISALDIFNWNRIFGQGFANHQDFSRLGLQFSISEIDKRRKLLIMVNLNDFFESGVVGGQPVDGQPLNLCFCNFPRWFLMKTGRDLMMSSVGWRNCYYSHP